MEWFFEVDNQRYVLKHCTSDDSRVITKDKDYRVLICINSTTEVFVYDKELQVRKKVGSIRSIDQHWCYTSRESEQPIPLCEHNDYNWKALRDAEIMLGKQLIVQFNLSTVEDPKLPSEVDSPREYRNVWTDDSN